MRGEVPLEDVYGRRLELIRPTRADVERVAALYVERLVPDAREVVAALLALGVDVRIVSGGLRPAVLAVARALGVPDDRVAAVDIYFDSSGSYAGFEDASPLARAGGKRDVVRSWLPMTGSVMLVGDGATDLEARDAVDLFVAYMGVTFRASVAEHADAVVRSFSLAPVFSLAIGARPLQAHYHSLYDRGVELMHGGSVDG